MSGCPPPPPPPPPAVKPKRMLTMTIQLATTEAGKRLGQNFIFFDYPDGLEVKRGRDHTTDIEVEEKSVNLFTSNEQRSLINATNLAGLGRDYGQNFSLSWGRHFSEHYAELRRTIQPHQSFNHLPSSQLLSHKDFLARTMLFFRNKFPKQYNFTPQTFVLPFDLEKLRSTLDAEPDSLWIEKPYASSRGRGIVIWSAQDKEKLIHKVTQPREELHPDLQNTAIKLKAPADPAAVVIQRYLQHPCLIDGLKFDLRLYVVVTSFEPLCCYIFNEGLGRFCTTPYTPEPETVGNAFAHLTNSSVNKYSENYEKNTGSNTSSMSKGSKRSYTAVLEQLQQAGVNVQRLRESINDVIVKTLIAISPHSRGAALQCGMHRQQGFELYGIDVMLDSDAQPHILELNYSPDISAAMPMDRFIKGRLVADTLNLAGIALPPTTRDATSHLELQPRNLGLDIPDEEDMRNFLVEIEEQNVRKGLFERIFPVSAAQVRKYADFLEPGNDFYGQDFHRLNGYVGHGDAGDRVNIASPAVVNETRRRYEILADLLEEQQIEARASATDC